MFQMSAAFGGWRVCLVDCAEDLNANGANALLKMIEEPPPRSLILIVSHRPGQVLPTIRSRCRSLRLDRLSQRPKSSRWSRRSGRPGAKTTPRRSRKPPERANGSVREALARLSPEAEGVGCADRRDGGGPAAPRSAHGAKLAEALGGRASTEAFDAFHRALYEWLAAYAAKTVSSPHGAWEIGALWDRIRTAARETEALNLDRKLHVLAVFAEIAASARRRR